MNRLQSNEQLVNLVTEIISLCDIALNESSSPNLDVVRLLKSEFEQQRNCLMQKDKVIVLNKKKDLWAARTIIDSGKFEYDKMLFDKVLAFGNLCRRLPLKRLIIQHS